MDGSGSQEALDYSERHNGRFITSYMGQSRHHSADKSHSTGVLCEMSFDLSDMERGEICHDRLADYMKTSAQAKLNAKHRRRQRGKSDVRAPYLSPGFSDFN